jgi:O-Antigen ligase
MRSGYVKALSILAAAVGALRRLPLEGAIRLAVPVTVVAVALGSNWSPSVRQVAQPLWKLLLALLCALAVAFALAHAGPRRLWESARSPAYALAAALVALAAASILWSADPRLTVERVASFSLVLVTAAALGLAAAGDRPLVERLLVAVAAGPVAVALLGLVVLAVTPHHALQEATQTIPGRYRGIGENPNTVPMLFAATLPLLTWLALEWRGRRRAAAILGLALLAGSIVGSGSRGALVTGAAGCLLVAVATATSPRGRLLAAAAVAVALAVSVGLGQIPQPNPSATDTSTTGCLDCKYKIHDADATMRLDDEYGAPGGADPGVKRTLFASTGRTQAWEGAVDQGQQRPVVGYGFGTEDHVFVDRYYAFFGGSPENSYVGVFLQLGLAGLALVLALAAALVLAGAAAIRRLDGEARRAAAACTAVVCAGLVLAVVQSYIYAAGNNATLTVWLCAFLGLALAARPAAAST